ncbi:energy transducer TonB [Candidatus Korobacter versatilis]
MAVAVQAFYGVSVKLYLSLLSGLLALGVANGNATAQQTSGNHPTAVEIAVFSEPAYPALAKQARVFGDVVITVTVNKDGTVISTNVVKGHPMLSEAAVKSARESRYTCRACSGDQNDYTLTYSFQASDSTGPNFPCKQDPDTVSRAGQNISILTYARLVIPYFSSVRVRSPKCLYAWPCGSHWGGEDYYYYPVRSPKCLGLWKCGHELREPFATCDRLKRSQKSN